MSPCAVWGENQSMNISNIKVTTFTLSYETKYWLSLFWKIGDLFLLLTAKEADGGGAKVNTLGSVQYLRNWFEAQELGFDEWSDAKVSVHFIVQCAPLQTNTKTLFSCTDPQQEAMCAPAHLCTSHCCTHKLLHYTLDSELWTCRTMLCASKCISVRRTSAHYAFLLTMHAHCYHSTLAHLSFKSVPGMAYGRHAGIH